MHDLHFIRLEGTYLVYYYVKNKQIVVLEHDLCNDPKFKRSEKGVNEVSLSLMILTFVKETSNAETIPYVQPAYLTFSNLHAQMVSFGYSSIAVAQAIQDNFAYGRLNGDLEAMLGIVMDYMPQMEPMEVIQSIS
jgi:hypothetical protein